jgi:heat-inducible transcriptional repressor
MLSERRRQILNALVREYIDSGQPVSSRGLVDQYGLGYSPATVRNELAALEEGGYVYQPHISSGRVPTDTGYRAFVDGLMESVDPIDPGDEADMRHRYLALADEVDDLMRRTSSVLSHLTHYVAVVMAPTISRARIRRVNLLSMGSRRALMVVITESGQVVNRQIELAEDSSPERLAEVERALNASLDGKRALDVRPLAGAVEAERPGDSLVARLLDEVAGCLDEADHDRLYHVGVPELLALPEFADSARLRPLVGLLEDGLAMLDTLSDAMRSGGVTVRIGSENTRHELGHMSLVATGYGPAHGDGLVGVIGPTRMDYPRTISAVRCAAAGLDDALG